MRLHLFFISLLFCFSANAQTWNNLDFNANQPNLEKNPLKGFATMWQPSNNFPHSIQGRLFGLDDIMIGIDNFNWTSIDNFLLQEAHKGNHAYLQVNIDPAFGGSDMPAFLVDKVEFQYYDDGNVPDLCPDWNDPDLMEAMLNFIDAFGKRYNGDTRVFLVHLGLYGMWGEWHIGNVGDIRPEFEMTEANKTLIADAYLKSFPDKYLLARYAENMPDPQVYGYSDGLFFSQSISPSNPWYFHNTLKAYDADQNWKLHPIGGEIDPDIQPIIWDNFPNQVGQDVYESFTAIRPTWLFSHHMLTDAQQGTAEWNNAIKAQKAMGYTFYLDKYRLSSSNGNPAIEVNLQNTGLTPMYANWDLEFGVLDSNNQFQSIGTTKWNLDLIQPDVIDNYRSFISDTTLADGTYTFLLRVINPLETISTNASPLRFANTSQDEDLEGWLTLGATTITSGTTGITPTKVSNLSLSHSSAVLQVGDQLQLSAAIMPDNATNPAITWVSDHPATAAVDANGLVTTGPTYGPATISAYTQDGGLKAVCEIIVEPFRVTIPAQIEAEDFVVMSGVVIEGSSEGSDNLGYIDNQDWMEYGVRVNTTSDFNVDFRVASPSGGGELKLLNEAEEILDILQIPSTGGWQTYTTITSKLISLPEGSYNLRVLASKGGFNLNWIEFRSDNTTPIESINTQSKIMVYPNPTQNKITINWEHTALNITPDNVKISNAFGANIIPLIVDGKIIDMSSLPNGIYFLEVTIKGEKLLKKVIKN